MTVPVPMFVLRRLVRANPWLLGNGIPMRRGVRFTVFIWEIEIQTKMELLPEQKARLIAERFAKQ